ncbi:MAG: hypothetical protein E2O85_02420 [Bacteroidetes bacterium]|nr:MAG: hypothetical protein E2O85_02420 [Bacteroidota bacterium]
MTETKAGLFGLKGGETRTVESRQGCFPRLIGVEPPVVLLRLRFVFSIFLSVFLPVISTSVRAQETSTDWAWKEITKIDGVEFFYIYYTEVRHESNGVVLKLVNWNDYSVTYRFRIVFKADGGEHDEVVTGSIGPETLVTGDAAGLFFLPFEDGRSIGEIGIKGYRIQRLEDRPNGSREGSMDGLLNFSENQSPGEIESYIRYIF